MTSAARPEPAKTPTAIKNMFTRLAGRYDVANRVMSLGRDLFWRRALARRLKILSPPGRLLDLAAGTGDQIVAAKRFFPNLAVVGLDLAPAMMALAAPKLARLPWPAPEMITGDALEIPFEEASFDSVSISFGLRNVASRPRLYQEVLRVLRPGGRFLVLEMYHERQALWSGVLKFYLCSVAPWLGGRLLSREREAYEYLAASIMAFPDPGSLMREMAGAGFTALAAKTYTLNTVMLVLGEKPVNEPFKS